MPEKPVILLLEDHALIQQSVTHMLGALGQPCELIITGTLAQARETVARERVDLFILDCGLPDGDGLDFLCEMVAFHPAARAIVFTAEPTAQRRLRAEALGILRFLQKPVPTAQFLEAVRFHLGHADAPRQFTATLSGITPMDIIQLKCLTGSTGALRFESDGAEARVWLEGGQPTHATLSRGSAVIEGEAALREISTWTAGSAGDARDLPAAPARTLHKEWQVLFMEIAQEADERAIA